ncbi:MAG: hypothetical protein K6A82_08360 [Prevotella sp.]|nr:hypothetical protein [Prevotella sp.]
MKAILPLFLCMLLLGCKSNIKRVKPIHIQPQRNTVVYWARNEKTEDARVINVISEKAKNANDVLIFGKVREGSPKQLNATELKKSILLVRKYMEKHPENFLPLDSYYQQYIGYVKEGKRMADVILFSHFKVTYDGLTAIRSDFRVSVFYYKPVNKYRHMLTINLDKDKVSPFQ